MKFLKLITEKFKIIAKKGACGLKDGFQMLDQVQD